MSDYDLILAKLRADLELPDTSIRAAINEEWAVKNALAPSVNVIYFDDVPTDGDKGRPTPRSQYHDRWWLIIVTTRNVADAGIKAVAESEQHRDAVLKSLLGCDLRGDRLYMRQEKSGRRYTVRGEYVHNPLMFSHRHLKKLL